MEYGVAVFNRQTGVRTEVRVSSSIYILDALEQAGVDVPTACVNGACTTCAMRVKSGKIDQSEAIGLSRQLQQEGYALICVGYACSDLELETQDENEVYQLQFGRYFAKQRKPLFSLPWE
ncbi:MAG: 2Fe-2S iron-sulfur cluster-binding protein [Pseudanabaenaceae cyanobacterium bins.68]|nr:2Fe-2S iron-sulfur cluster-binding protein [Pseudanabaenaceae cyanobacterium bins.68]